MARGDRRRVHQMKPVSPVIPDTDFEELKIAEHQDEYGTLPALVCNDGNTLLTRWEMTDAEIAELQKTKSLYLYISNFGQPVQPVLLTVEPPEFAPFADIEEAFEDALAHARGEIPLRTTVLAVDKPCVALDVYIPPTLDAALDLLERQLSPENLAWVICATEGDINGLHHSFGMYVRNTWRLWFYTPLAIHFNRLGITHADDMSGIILTSFWRRMHNAPLRLDEQIAHYRAYWSREIGRAVP